MARILQPEDVLEGFEILQDLQKYIRQKHPFGGMSRAEALILQTLEEQKYHLYHHLLGPECPVLDMDHFEIRGILMPYLVSVTMSPNSPSDYSKYHYKQIANKINATYLELIADISDYYNPKFTINGKDHSFEDWAKLLGSNAIKPVKQNLGLSDFYK